MAWEDFDDIAAHPKSAAKKRLIVSLILKVDKFLKISRRSTRSPTLRDKSFLVGLHGADAINTGDGGDKDHIPPFQQRPVAEWRIRSIRSLIEASFSI